MSDSEDSAMLSLGDIIVISSPQNIILNGNKYVISYIDDTRVELLSKSEPIHLEIKDGSFTDTTITGIKIIYKNPEIGFARQNGLLPGSWLDITFQEETTIVLTGVVTNLEEDMIEFKTYPDSDVLYINFGYKGVPDDLNIINISHRHKPEVLKRIPSHREDEDAQEPMSEAEISEKDTSEKRKRKNIENEDIGEEVIESAENEESIINSKGRLRMRSYIIDADQIVVGERLGQVTQIVNVAQGAERYSLFEQLEDLNDELIAKIPAHQRTPYLLDGVHTTVERFQQLRQYFSVMDENINVKSALKHGKDWKPLSNNLVNFKIPLSWIVPVAISKKKIYDADVLIDVPDVIFLETVVDIESCSEVLKAFGGNVVSDINQYATLLRDINPYFTPFATLDMEDNTETIRIFEVNRDMTVVMNNLSAFESTVWGDTARTGDSTIGRKKFLFEGYERGQTRLQTINATSTNLITKRIDATEPDIIHLRSIITLPEPVVKYSKVFLPSTTILERCSLGMTDFMLSRLLRHSTKLKNILIDNLDESLYFDTNDYIDTIHNYEMGLPASSSGYTDKQYCGFLNTMVPKTKVLFAFVRKYISGRMSVHDIISYMEPFLVYIEDLTYFQYVEIVKFIGRKMLDHAKDFRILEKAFMSLFSGRPPTQFNANVLTNILRPYTVDNADFLSLYCDYKPSLTPLSTSELLKALTLSDDGRLFSCVVAKENFPLMLPEDISGIIEEQRLSDVDKNKTSVISAQKSNTCVQPKLAKRYINEEALHADDGKSPIFYDKIYDPTNYAFVDKWESERSRLSDADFHDFIIGKLTNMTPVAAQAEADALVLGRKIVEDGAAAMIYLPHEARTSFYEMKDGYWVPFRSVVANDDSTLCNLQPSCLSNETDSMTPCKSFKLSKKLIMKSQYQTIMSEFNGQYDTSKTQLHETLDKEFAYLYQMMPKRNYLRQRKFLKYNDMKFALAAAQDTPVTESPYSQLMENILISPDFVKKQGLIISFFNEFTRQPTGDENINYYYCIKTNIPLLPTFYVSLATIWLAAPQQYMTTLDSIVTQRGVKSDDGDSIVDKFSGRIITHIRFDVDEGYDNGFRVTSRDKLGEDLVVPETIFIAKDARIINGIIMTLSKEMHIDMSTNMEFIVRTVSKIIANDLPSESTYQPDVKGKSTDYETLYSTTILYLSLATFVIAIQTSIPSVQTRKTFPGCTKSFEGYPLSDDGDLSAINYVSCVAYNIGKGNPHEPWSVIKRGKEKKINDNIKKYMDTYLVGIEPEVVSRTRDKKSYILTEVKIDEPFAGDLQKWVSFLPPLMPIHVRPPRSISESLKDEIFQRLRGNPRRQAAELISIQSKIIFFSLALQEHVQSIVQKMSNDKMLILKTSANVPYVDNACCTDVGGATTLQYFISKDHQIGIYNQTVIGLTKIIHLASKLAEAPRMFCQLDAKLRYPPTNMEYNTETIYRAFIHYCRFNSLVPISQTLVSICKQKPNFSPGDTLSMKIRKLNDMGQKYTALSLDKLLLLVSRQNTVTVSVNETAISKIGFLRELLPEIKSAIAPLIGAVIDSFDVVLDKNDESYKALYNFLKTNIRDMLINLKLFVKSNLPGSHGRFTDADAKRFDSRLDALLSQDHGVPNDHFNAMRQIIANLANVFPSIITNKGPCGRMTQTPKHWNISRYDKLRITDIVGDYYKDITKFFDVIELDHILHAIPAALQNILKLSYATPFIQDITYKGTVVSSIFNEQIVNLLYNFYLLESFAMYTHLSDEDSMVVRTASGGEDDDEGFTVKAIEAGYKKTLRHNVAKLLYSFIGTINQTKKISDTTYEEVISRIYVAKRTEKDNFTLRLRDMSKEERRVDTVFKLHKIGLYNRGMQKSLTTYTGELDVEGGEAFDAARALNQMEENVEDEPEEEKEEGEDEGGGNDSDEENGIGNFRGDDADGDPEGDELEDDYDQ